MGDARTAARADTMGMNTKPTAKAIRNSVEAPTQWGTPDPRLARLNAGSKS